MLNTFLVVGCGSIGKRHIANMRNIGIKNIIACDLNKDRVREVRSKFGIKSLNNLEEAWNYNPQVAFVTTPTSLHIPIAMEAAERGCHLFIEKPLSDTFENVDKLLEIVRRKNLVTLVGCNMRFHPGLQKVKELINQNIIGIIVAARIEAGQYLPDWHPFEDYRKNYSARIDLGGGVILDAIHELDYACWLFGEIEAVVCFADHKSHLKIETEDTAAIILRFKNGVIGEIHLDYVQRVYSRSCQIIGDEGTIRWDYNEGTVHCYTTATNTWEIFDTCKNWSPNQMYIEELGHFLRCIKGKEQPVQDVFSGAKVLNIALAAKSSAKLGRIEKL